MPGEIPFSDTMKSPGGSQEQVPRQTASPQQSTSSSQSRHLPSPPAVASKPRRLSTGQTITDRVGSIIGADGRTYQGYMPGEYLLPNDGDEQNRQDIQHHIYRILLDGELTAASVGSPKHVLDVGTGTGIWALEFAEAHPESHVVGTDLSSIQPIPRLSNVEFWVENSETQEWVFQYLFDYIHIRSMGPCFNDFMTVVEKSYDNLNPGGWLETVDVSWEIQCGDNTVQGTALEQFLQRLVIGGAKLGRDMIKARFYRDYLIQAGFVDVRERIVPAPLTAWAADPKLQTVGFYAASALYFGVESYRNFIMASGLSPEEIDELTQITKEDLQRSDIHAYFYTYFVYGRKPYEGETPSRTS